MCLETDLYVVFTRDLKTASPITRRQTLVKTDTPTQRA